MSWKGIGGLLSSVGFVTVPRWLRARQLLSTGEAARADLARALASDHDPAVVDEFTSTVDRQVGRVCSHAVAKTVRRRGQRFVLVTWQEVVIPGPTPAWIYPTDPGRFNR